jgi:hypothetical protein
MHASPRGRPDSHAGFRIGAHPRSMTVKRVRRLLATAALVLFVPGGASTALGDVESPGDEGPRVAALQQTPTTTAAQRQRRAEAAWLAEQLRAARRPPS